MVELPLLLLQASANRLPLRLVQSLDLDRQVFVEIGATMPSGVWRVIGGGGRLF